MEENKQMEATDGSKESMRKKTKSLVSLCILLAGFLAGSVFIDVVQLVRGGGYSPRALRSTDVFEAEGKTWVAFNEPIVEVKALTDDNCENCKTDEVVLSLRKSIPTIVAKKVDDNSEEGRQLAAAFELKTIPAFIFSSAIEKTSVFDQIQPVLEKKDDQYALKASMVGIPVGKYLESPAINDSDVQIGDKDSKVKIVEFTNFQSPGAKLFNDTAKKAMADYGDRALFVFKHLVSETNIPATNASLASMCANEQNKFADYANILFDKQDEWAKLQTTQKFKDYARQLKLNANQFNQCLDSGKYSAAVAAGAVDAEKMNIGNLPVTFVNAEFFDGPVGYDKLKEGIEKELNK